MIHYHGGDDSLLLDQSEARDKIRDALPFAIAEPPADWMVQRRNDATMRHCHATRAVAEADGCVRDDATVVSDVPFVRTRRRLQAYLGIAVTEASCLCCALPCHTLNLLCIGSARAGCGLEGAGLAHQPRKMTRRRSR